MNTYITAIWIAVGIIPVVYGLVVSKAYKFNLIFWFGKSKVKDINNFTDFYGKAITFLGAITIASAVISIGVKEFGFNSYFWVSVALNSLGVIYFIFEAFHLVKLYSKDSETPSEE